MLLSIESSIPTFKTIQFHEGLNVLLADTRPNSTEKQTRNSAGKTSLVEIIHFLFGSNCEKNSLFRTSALINHTFYGRFLIEGKTFHVARRGSDSSKIFLLDGCDIIVDLPKRKEKETGYIFVLNDVWRQYLGHAFFALPLDLKGTIFEESFTPTFRSLFSYFVRRRNSGAFISSERQSEMQQRWDWQVNLSYLFGLDWQIPFKLNKIRIRERTLDELKKAAKGGAFGEIVGTVAELRPQVAIAEAKAEKLREQLANFEVLDSYQVLSRQAASAKSKMQEIGREAVSLNETLEHLKGSLEFERPPGRSNLQRLYTAAGIELPGVALRRFEEVEKFYESVIKNRRTHLQKEISDIQELLAEGQQKLTELDNERSSILKMLEGHGALDDFVQLQRELSKFEAAAATLRERFKAAEVLEGEATQLDIDRNNLKRRLQEDHQNREGVLNEAIRLIANVISELYEDRQGRFVVEATNNGPEFRISIEGDRGGGISNMEIFCFDIALMMIVSKRLGGPGFLLHDSHLFDGVDERQISRALMLGGKATSNNGLQYIVTMNSDIFNRLPISADFDFTQSVLPKRLSDETETGGLFGFRFE